MYLIRLAVPNDLKQLNHLLAEVKIDLKKRKVTQWDEHYPSQLEIEEDIHAKQLIVSEGAGQIVGCVTCDPGLPEYVQGKYKGYFIKRLMVEPKYTSRGIGHDLLDYCLNDFAPENSTFYALTNHTNQQMHKFLLRNGFQKIDHVVDLKRKSFGTFDFFRKIVGASNMAKVVSLGSMNIDMLVTVAEMPQIGETLLGKNMTYLVGGKGANQAVASARIGTETAMLGKVGQDSFGETVRRQLVENQVKVTDVVIEDSAVTGIATVFKVDNDNCIIVSPGANGQVDEAYVNEKIGKLTSKDILLSQLEIPIMAVLAGFKAAKQRGATTILNPAPYNEQMVQLLPYTDILTPNEHEFFHLIGKKELTQEQLTQEILRFAQAHQLELVVTLGDEGVIYTEKGQIKKRKAVKVSVVDTTGAGDTFNGVFAGLLAQNFSYDEAIQLATKAASINCTKMGAQTGMPTLQELQAFGAPTQ